MIKAIESNLYRIEKAKGYEHEAIKIIKKETWNDTIVLVEELDELIELIDKSKEIIF